MSVWNGGGGRASRSGSRGEGGGIWSASGVWHGEWQWSQKWSGANMWSGSGSWDADAAWSGKGVRRAHVRGCSGQATDHRASSNSQETEEEIVEKELWTEIWVDVMRIRFSQEQIHPFFHKLGPILDVLPEIENEAAIPEDCDFVQDLSGAAPTVRLLPPFPPIRCIHRTEHHSDLTTLDNRRLYALQSAAVERWPARCLVRVSAAEQLSAGALQTEYRKLAEGGLGPLGGRAGKPAILMEYLCGDGEVHLCSRNSSFTVWHIAQGLLARCGTEEERQALHPPRPSGLLDVEEEEAARSACERALTESRDALRRERGAHSALGDLQSISFHAVMRAEMFDALERLRFAAAAAPGLLVQRVGPPGDRDGYISIVARAAALKRLG